jgi:hypothetical protein
VTDEDDIGAPLGYRAQSKPPEARPEHAHLERTHRASDRRAEHRRLCGDGTDHLLDGSRRAQRDPVLDPDGTKRLSPLDLTRECRGEVEHVVAQFRQTPAQEELASTAATPTGLVGKLGRQVKNAQGVSLLA